MKKLALFLGGVLVGWFGFAYVLIKGEEMHDDVLCDTDEYTIKRANNAIAFINYK